MLSNPYIAGNPVGGSNAFIGRADVLRSVLRVLKSPSENAIVLYGQRRIGKTSVLQELAQRLPQEGAYQPIYFDLQDKAALPLAKVLEELAKRIAQQIAMDMPALDSNDLPHAFREDFIPAALEHLSFHAAQKTSLVLLFDEFDVLDNPGKNQAGAVFFPYLRELLTFNRRLQFVFVIGRRPEDLSSLTLSVFKGVKSERISLLSPEDTAALVRLAEANHSLHWTDAAANHIYNLTGGHPFLTQQLCQEIWEAAYQNDPVEPPIIEPAAIAAAVSATLRSATNALEWLWKGLSPAQRIVAAALAEAGNRVITQEELESRLQKSGVRILVGELQDAPLVLQAWDLIEPAPEGYHFRVELLRRWIVERKPLARVQEELDRIQPVADGLFQAAYGYYQGRQLEQAVPLLRQAVGLNPNHTQAALLLSEILLAQGEVAEARQLLETLYQVQPAAARPRLVQALLVQARGEMDDDSRWTLYEQILTLEPNQTEAVTAQRQIWLRQAAALEKAGRYAEALTRTQALLSVLPANDPQRTELATLITQLERKTQLATLYQRAVGALEAKDQPTAIRLFSEVLALEPNYQEATRYLHLAVTGVDAQQLATALETERARRQQQERQAEQAQAGLKAQLTTEQQARQTGENALRSEKELRRQRETELEQLRRQLNLTKLNPFVRFFRQPPAPFTWTLGLLATVFFLVLANEHSFWPFVRGSSALAPTATPQPAAQANPGSPPPPIPTNDPSKWEKPPPANPITGTTWVDSRSAITLVYVPAGPFIMGSNITDTITYTDERPPHKVVLDGFWIMQTEVTNAQYAKCVAAKACDNPNNDFWEKPEFAQHPVVNVNWTQASAYAAWVGGQLPTEAQWEKAARGPNGLIYPWGNAWDVSDAQPRLNFCDKLCDNSWKDSNVSDGYAQTAPVGHYPAGHSLYGALDMAGNVWEWVSDWYAADYYKSAPPANPPGPDTGSYRVLRGGSWSGNRTVVRAADRYWYSPGNQGGNVGLRVVRVPSPGF
ncbi:MAG: SUMF1/EgtB/PvdO family nonheme iron enzyme [Caldilineaceae bacterium]